MVRKVSTALGRALWKGAPVALAEIKFTKTESPSSSLANSRAWKGASLIPEKRAYSMEIRSPVRAW
jgi:hypothetical protein